MQNYEFSITYLDISHIYCRLNIYLLSLKEFEMISFKNKKK